MAVQKGYKVDRNGVVFSPFISQPRKPYRDKHGYLRFSVMDGKTSRCCPVHRLQAYQKFGDKIYEDGIEVRHLDGNPSNNSWDNIEIGTHSDNMMDRPKEVRARLAGNANRKYDAEAVRAFYAATRSYKRTMAEFGIPSKGTLNYILRSVVAVDECEVAA